MIQLFLPGRTKHLRILAFVFSVLLGIVLLSSLGDHTNLLAQQNVRAAQQADPSAPNKQQPDVKSVSGASVVTGTPTPTCGLRWRDMDYPFPNTAYGMATISSSDVWLVTTSGVTHWDGAQWSFSGPLGTLQDISALTPTDIWAVGYTNNGGGSANSLIVHWDGMNWATVTSPNPDPVYNALDGVKAIAPDNVWAVGEQTGVLHWDGTQWTQVYFPGTHIYLRDIDALAANDIWAVGNESSLPSYTVALHWDGADWSRSPSPNPSTNENVLQAVVTIAANDVWAAGFQCCFAGGAYRTLTEHWDGSQWSLVSSVDPGNIDDKIIDLAAASHNEVWAVGSFQDSSRGSGPLVEQWDGQQWTYFPVEEGRPGVGPINAAAALSPTDIWAAGSVVVRYHDPCSTPEPSSTATPPATFLPTRTHTATPTITPTATATVLVSTHTPTSTSVPPTGTQPPSVTSTPTSTTQASSATPTGTPSPIAQVTLTATATVAPCTLSFSDVQANDYFYQPVLYLACRGAISGYEDGTFRPYNDTTRGQLSKIIVLASGWALDTSGGPHFADVPNTSPFYLYIETAYHHGVIAGYSDGTFRWGSNVTRAQLTKITVLARGWELSPPESSTFTDVPPGHPFYSYIETAYAHQIITGYSCGTGCLEFRPGNFATRGQIAKIVYSAVMQP